MNQQDKDRLRELAGKVVDRSKATQSGDMDFHQAANPATILSLLEENEALAKKAARYDWLRSGDTDLLIPFHTEDGLPVGVAFDDAVDAAMQHKGD